MVCSAEGLSRDPQTNALFLIVCFKLFYDVLFVHEFMSVWVRDIKGVLRLVIFFASADFSLSLSEKKKTKTLVCFK